MAPLVMAGRIPREVLVVGCWLSVDKAPVLGGGSGGAPPTVQQTGRQDAPTAQRPPSPPEEKKKKKKKRNKREPQHAPRQRADGDPPFQAQRTMRPFTHRRGYASRAPGPTVSSFHPSPAPAVPHQGLLHECARPFVYIHICVYVCGWVGEPRPRAMRTTLTSQPSRTFTRHSPAPWPRSSSSPSSRTSSRTGAGRSSRSTSTGSTRTVSQVEPSQIRRQPRGTVWALRGEA